MDKFQLYVFILLFLIRFISCTDIAAVYKHSVLLIKNADKISESQPISWESAELDLPEPLLYPMGIASDPQNGRLFVTDAMHIENSIFTLQFSSNGSIDAMYPLLKKTHTKDIRLIEDIFYDGHTSQLYWTDSYQNSLDKAHVPENPQDMLTEKPKPVHNFGNVKKPRGVALDYCNNLLYWSELNDKERNIEVCDLDGKYRGVVRTASDNSNEYFLGMTYDMSSGHVIWSETEGKEINSTCRILSSDFRETSDHEATITHWAELDNCYPFALTSDDEYIYWADWSRNGIMRLSKTNPDQIIKILEAPMVVSDAGTHYGVFGLTPLGKPSVEEIEKICSHHRTYFEEQQSFEAVKRVDPESISSKVPFSTPTVAQQIEKQAQSVTEVNIKTEIFTNPQEENHQEPFNSQETKDQLLVIRNQKDKEEHHSMQGFDRIVVDSTTVDEKIELLMMVKSDGHINASFSPKKGFVFILVALLACFLG